VSEYGSERQQGAALASFYADKASAAASLQLLGLTGLIVPTYEPPAAPFHLLRERHETGPAVLSNQNVGLIGEP
jgi:hypothetical protein